MALKHIILETNGRHEPQAFLVCTHDFIEREAASGQAVFSWRSGVWLDCLLWAFDPAALRKTAAEHLSSDVIHGVLITAQSKGYAGPPQLPSVAAWTGVPCEDYELARPLDRCRLMAAVLRSERLR